MRNAAPKARGKAPQGRPATRRRLIDRFGTPALVAVSAVGLALFAGLVTKGDGSTAAGAPQYEPPAHSETTAAPPVIPETAAPAVAQAMEIDDTAGTPFAQAAQPAAAAPAPIAARAAASLPAASTKVAVATPATNAAGRCEDRADQGAADAAKGNYAAAEASYKATLLCNGGYFPARVGLADAVWAQGDHTRAAALYRDLVDTLPSDMVPARARERSSTHANDATATNAGGAATGPAASDAPFAKEL